MFDFLAAMCLGIFMFWLGTLVGKEDGWVEYHKGEVVYIGMPSGKTFYCEKIESPKKEEK